MNPLKKNAFRLIGYISLTKVVYIPKYNSIQNVRKTDNQVGNIDLINPVGNQAKEYG
jgi:hypothetical protein